MLFEYIIYTSSKLRGEPVKNRFNSPESPDNGGYTFFTWITNRVHQVIVTVNNQFPSILTFKMEFLPLPCRIFQNSTVGEC